MKKIKDMNYKEYVKQLSEAEKKGDNMYKITLNNLKKNLENPNENINKMLELNLIQSEGKFLVIKDQKNLNFIQFKFGFLLSEDWTKHIIKEESQEDLIKKLKETIETLDKKLKEEEVFYQIIEKHDIQYVLDDEDFFIDHIDECVLRDGDRIISSSEEAYKYAKEVLKLEDEELEELENLDSLDEVYSEFDEFRDLEMVLRVQFTTAHTWNGLFKNKKDAEKEIQGKEILSIREVKINKGA